MNYYRKEADKVERKRRMRGYIVVCLLFALIMSTGCTSAQQDFSSEERPYPDEDMTVIGVSQLGSESMWRSANTASIQQVFTKENGYFLMYNNARQKQENQIKAVRSFVAQGVDAIFIAPVVATGWEPVLKEAKDAEIPVFLLDRSIDVKDKSLYMTTVTADNILEGKLIGDWLVKEVNGKPCNVVELQGTVGASVAIDRKKGFAEAIKNAPNIKIIRSQSGDFTRSKGKEVMESFIKAENNGKNICMVYAHNDDMVIGAIQAIKEAGLKPGKDILTGSIDGVPDIYKAMIDGEANASVELTPNMAGPAFDALEKYKKDGTMPEKLTLTKSTLYLPDTAKEELEKKKNMGY